MESQRRIPSLMWIPRRKRRLMSLLTCNSSDQKKMSLIVNLSAVLSVMP
jgi:hypothetical protein